MPTKREIHEERASDSHTLLEGVVELLPVLFHIFFNLLRWSLVKETPRNALEQGEFCENWCNESRTFIEGVS
jgi:hypothetical protein